MYCNFRAADSRFVSFHFVPPPSLLPPPPLLSICTSLSLIYACHAHRVWAVCDPSTKNTLSLFFLFLFFLLFAFCFSSRILQAIRRNHIVVVVGVFNIISGFIAGSIWFCKHTWEKRCERWRRVTGKARKKTKCFYLCNFRVENSAKKRVKPHCNYRCEHECTNVCLLRVQRTTEGEKQQQFGY